MALRDPAARDAYQKAYREANRERRAAQTADYRRRNKDKTAAGMRRWAKANPEIYRAMMVVNHANMAAKKYGQPGRLRAREVLPLILLPCAYCGGKSDGLDHVLPLKRGGANDLSNVVQSCFGCNAKKQNRTPEEWLSGVSIGRNGWRPSNTKLTEADVIEIRRRYTPRKVTFRQLGLEYGVGEKTIEMVVRRRSWKSVA